MKTMKNRVLSGAMAGVLAMSLAVPAFAADDHTTVVTGKYQDTPIAVTVPETGKAFINPYGLNIEVPEDAEDSSNTNKTTISGQQIVSAPMAIMNQSAMDLNVNVTVTGKVAALSDATAIPMKLATVTTKGVGAEGDDDYVAPATAKSAFVYLQAKTATDTSGAAAALATEFAGWAASDYDADKDIIVGTKAATKEGIAVLRAATPAAGGSSATYNAGSIALFRLTGDCVATPKTAWTEEDSFEATLAFSFRPATIAKNAITAAVNDTSAGAGTIVAAPTSAAEGDTVTITVSGILASDTVAYSVTKADGSAFTPAITVTDGTTTGTTRTATFTMPGEAVKVTATVTA